MSFKKLADEVAALAAAGVATDTPADGGNAGKTGDATGSTLAKSFEFELEDGTKVVAEDGTAMLKSMQEAHATEMGEIKEVLTGVTALLKSQQTAIAALLGSGRGQRSVRVAMPAGEAAPAAPAAPAGTPMLKSHTGEQVNGTELLAKSHEAHAAGRITGLDVAIVESYANRGLVPGADLMQRIHG